jgi:hypothetical protein
MRFMEDVPPGPDAVRAYLDSAVAEAAERWVGRAADATAYADLVAAVLARREALSPLTHLPDHFLDQPLPVRPGLPARHHERRARPRWPLQGEPPPATAFPEPGTTGGSAPPAPHTPSYPRRELPFGAQLDVRGAAQLPSRPPGRHRLPARESEPPRAIDLSENLNTVLDWLGRPDV